MGVIQRQGIKNAIISYLGVIIGFVNLLIIQPNYLTKEEVGLVRMLFAFCALVATFLPMGINSVTTRYFPHFRNAEKRHYGYFGFMLIFPLLGLLVFAAGLWAFKPLIVSYYAAKSSLFTNYFDTLLPFILILGLVSVLYSYAYSLLKTTVPSLLNDVFTKAALILLTIAYFYKWFDLDHFVYYMIGVYALQLLLVLAYILYEDRPGLKIDFSFLKGQNPKGMMKYGFLLSFSALTGLGLKYIDALMLGHYVTLDIVGIYAIAALIPTVIEAPLNALDKIASPKIAYAYAANNKEEIKNIYYKSTKYLLLFGGLLFLGININIAYLYQLTAHGFAAGINVVFIISLGTLINMATGLNDSILFNSKKYIYGTYLLLMLFVLAIVNNLIFIPLYGMEGAALATVLSSFIYNTVKYLYIWKAFKLQPFDRFTALTLLLIIGCLGINYILPTFDSAILNILFRSAVIITVYLSGTIALKIVPEFHKYIPFRR